MVAALVAPVVAEDRAQDGPPHGSFLDSLVARVQHEYGADPGEIRSRAMAALAAFAGARVQTFVPILVEKRLRETYRGDRADR